MMPVLKSWGTKTSLVKRASYMDSLGYLMKRLRTNVMVVEKTKFIPTTKKLDMPEIK
jgi:hypothetical protein